MTKMKEIKKAKQIDDLLKSSGGKLVVIDFFADWCGPCRSMGPRFEKMATEFPDVIFAKVNIEKGKEIAVRYGIASIPYFKLIKNKKEVTDVRGADEASLREQIITWKDASEIEPEGGELVLDQ